MGRLILREIIGRCVNTAQTGKPPINFLLSSIFLLNSLSYTIHNCKDKITGGAVNDSTMVLQLVRSNNVPFKVIFERSFSYISYKCLQSKAELMVFVFDGDTCIGKCGMHRHAFDISSLVLGRHTECPIRLSANSISLRQLLIILYPSTSQLQYQVVDLNSASGFMVDEETSCRNIWANGASFIRIQQYTIMILPSKIVNWKKTSFEECWRIISHRNYELGERLPSKVAAIYNNPLGNKALNLAELEIEKEPDVPSDATFNTIVSKLPPLWLEKIRETAEPVVELRLGDSLIVALDQVRLQQGVIVGRYDRCGLSLKLEEQFQRVSRMHCMIIHILGRD